MFYVPLYYGSNTYGLAEGSVKAVLGREEADEHHLHFEGALRDHDGQSHVDTPGRLGKPDSLSSPSLSPVAWLGLV